MRGWLPRAALLQLSLKCLASRPVVHQVLSANSIPLGLGRGLYLPPVPLFG